MVLVEHTFDAKCRQTPVSFPMRDGGMPSIKAQFFYSSSIPIDDPLSASSHTATTDQRRYKELLRPFGRGDNNALETAWLSLSTIEHRIRHEALRSGNPGNRSLVRQDAESREKFVQRAASKHRKLHAGVRRGQDIIDRTMAGTGEPQEPQDELCCPELLKETKKQLQRMTCSLARVIDPTLSPEAIAKDIAALVARHHFGQHDDGYSRAATSGTESQRTHSNNFGTNPHLQRSTPKQIRVGGIISAGNSQSNRSSPAGIERRKRSDSQLSDASNRTNEMTRNSAPRDGITGKPFARVDTSGQGPELVGSPIPHNEVPYDDVKGLQTQTQHQSLCDKKHNVIGSPHDWDHAPASNSNTKELKTAQVTVAVNIELGNPTIQNVLRADQNGFMILPLNWRVGLSFDNDDEAQKGAKDLAGAFDLKDIEPSTIPAVRSMISDVMFDIPFYMSHHKNKMINALVREANRVYRLWCRNNPGFSDKGRVHLIAHSLGSVMAVDILSRQPTSVPKLNLATQTALEEQHFEFNTTNLFLAGSPAGFFLLLEKGALTPRRDRPKPGADDGDVVAKDVVGEAGTFGCLAVDNVYNILAKEDPIAYLLTGAIDPSYASSLKVAYVPSVTPSLMSTVRDAIRQVVPGLTPEPDPLAVEPERPIAARMPSQLELEIHNFSREEIAEKKAYLLNDNGQIDWFLRSSGGPLEIQYLNMLSAHTSYWTNHDFIRMVCLEIGRKPGRSHTFPAMRAVKNSKRDSKKDAQ
ncbi:hypothetical protein V2A60_009018 [Cordyceps javanica]|uniref:Ddhd domain-containing protein n=1 Tax=Cordyceps javanica TaxID=43265 RepID=A0A545UPD6_9HYPO|nr:ddhd domain-containing protein [Cordyceps javanica]TQW03256.1 DDHD domain-containing protein [Cordyceps javanica]